MTDLSVKTWVKSKITQMVAAVLTFSALTVVMAFGNVAYAGPNDLINRAEFAKLIVIAEGWQINTAGGPHFSDVSVNSWYYPYVETMYNNFVMMGYADGTFKPYNLIVRAEAAKYFNLAILPACQNPAPAYNNPQYYNDVIASTWFYGHVKKLADCKMVDILPGPRSNYFPSDWLTQGRAQAMLNNAKKAGWIK